jgi:DNA-directed RNA polymerase subunit RPC12/RpoP
MDEKIKKWVNAANILGKHPKAKVICPECGNGYLTTKDELIDDWPDKIDRYMICSYCGKYNILTMGKPKV